MTRGWPIGMLWLALVFGPMSAHAQTCTFTISNGSFGSVSPLATQSTDVIINAVVNCSGFATPNAHVCASLAGRKMTGPGGTPLSYDLFIDAARTRSWGSLWDTDAANALTTDVALSGGAGSKTVPIYGRIFPGQSSLPVGSYSQGFNGSGYTGLNAAGFTTSPPVCTTTTGLQTPFSFSTSATLTTDCTLSATSIDFGQVGLITVPVNTTGAVTVTCTNGTAYTVSLDAGRGAGATVSSRKLTRSGSSDTLAYGLYINAARSSIWGDGSNGSGTVSGTGNGAAQPTTVYASLLAPASVPPGTYVDTVIATISY